MTLLLLPLLVISVSGCSLAGGQQTVDIEAMEARLESATGITLEQAPEISTAPGLTNLASSRAGGNLDGELLLLEFFSKESADEALGGIARSGSTRAFSVENAVVLYTPGPSGRQLTRAIRLVVEEASSEPTY